MDYAFCQTGPDEIPAVLQVRTGGRYDRLLFGILPKVLDKAKSQRVPIREQMQAGGGQLAKEKPHQRSTSRRSSHRQIRSENMCCPTFPMCSSAGCSSSWERRTVWPLAQISRKSCSGLGQTVGAAFADFAPGLAPSDWLVGIVGAVAFRLLIYFKSKNAKKFRRDAEYGSARWETEKDIKPFVDPKFENNVHSDRDGVSHHEHPPEKSRQRPQPQFLRYRLVRLRQDPLLAHAPASAGSFLLCGGRSRRAVCWDRSGAFSAKTRATKSRCSTALIFQNPCTITRWRISRPKADILKFVNALISNTKGEGKEGDPFWTKAETLLYCALMAYIIFEGPPRKIGT